MLYANVIVDISHEKLDKCFQYIIPAGMENKIHAGVLVKIPFGKGNRQISGYVIEVTDKPEFDVSKMKSISEIVEKSVPIEGRLINLAWFIKENYGSTMNQALKTVIPVKVQTKSIEKKTVILNIDKDRQNEYTTMFEKKRAVARLRCLNELVLHNELPYKLITEKLNVSAKTIKELEELGIVRIETERMYRSPIAKTLDSCGLQDELSHQPQNPQKSVILNDIQQKTVDNIRKDNRTVQLIHGVTGSGKTEVYMELIDDVIKEGKEAIVLIPEIALTYQTVMRFYARFGELVAIVNSKLAAGERYDQFELAKQGKIKIMIGPRSAIFTPFRNLGLIIIDEEHEGTYKSENVPKYHAREVAVFRAAENGAKVVLGSATPSVDSYYRAKTGEYALHEMNERAKLEAKLPQVYVEDLRKELENGNKTMFSERLNSLIIDRLQKKEQIILFINRRGYAGFVSCRSCGHVMKCPHCDVGLTYHNNNATLVCHYCNYVIPMPKLCPECGSKYIATFGTGTQKVEEAVKRMYPTARALRMDMDTTSVKYGHEKILSAFANGEADILIGTQMIVKGHDFPNVTLVGVIAADLSLYAADYRASERTFQLLTQAAGRAGRGNREGEVVIQTYTPENFAIEAASKQDYKEFYEREIMYRTLMEYPPAYYMMAVLMSAKDEVILSECCDYVKNIAEKYVMSFDEERVKDIRFIGPAKAGISKINDVYRMVYYIKSSENGKLVDIKNIISDGLENEERYKNVGVQFDFNPMGNY